MSGNIEERLNVGVAGFALPYGRVPAMRRGESSIVGVALLR